VPDSHPSGDKRFKLLDAAMKKHQFQADALLEVTKFSNGSAAGQVLMLKHSPVQLRVVQSPSSAGDALDLRRTTSRSR
jgi:hypothetical protein